MKASCELPHPQGVGLPLHTIEIESVEHIKKWHCIDTDTVERFYYIGVDVNTLYRE